MAMYTCKDDSQRRQINAFMTSFQEHPQAWSRVDGILEQTKCDQSKFFVSISLSLTLLLLYLVFACSASRAFIKTHRRPPFAAPD